MECKHRDEHGFCILMLPLPGWTRCNPTHCQRIRADERAAEQLATLKKVRDWLQEIQYGYGANPQVGDWLLMWDDLCDHLNEVIEEARD